jgi:hypothetical protein
MKFTSHVKNKLHDSKNFFLKEILQKFFQEFF